MTTQQEGSKWVGNAGLIIGLPWHKRKSLPRNSKGFEPIEGYFDHTSTEGSASDSDDSSETDTEELVRQEREKRIEAEAQRKKREERKNAAYLMKLVAEQKQAEVQARAREAERQEEEERRQRERENLAQAQREINSVPDNDEDVEVVDVGSNVEVPAVPKSLRSANTSEGMYSPDMSVAIQHSPSSVARKSIRLLPSRLSFSGGEGENSSDAEPTNTLQKSHKSSSKSAKNLDSTFLTTSCTTDTVSLTNDDILIQRADHILATTESSFHPGKTSTQLKKQQKSGAKKGKRSTKLSKGLPTAIHPLDQMQFSESDSERDETLEVLLADNSEHFQGLKSHLAKSKMVTISDSLSTTTISNDSAKTMPVEGEKSKPRRFAKKSTGNMAGKLTQKETKAKSRKSVTFLAASGSEMEEDFRDKGRTAKAPPTAVDDIYMSFDDDDFGSSKSLSKKGGKAKKPKKSREPPTNDEVQSNSTAGSSTTTRTNLTSFSTRKEMTDSGSELSDDPPPQTEEPSFIPTKSATSTFSAVNGSRSSTTLVEEEVPANRMKDRRARISETPEHVPPKAPSPKSILKNVSLVLNKPAAATSQYQSQWFVPDVDVYRKKRTRSLAQHTYTTMTADSAGVSVSGIDTENDDAEPKKRKRGRPRKSESEQGSKLEAKRRGRPPKYMAPPLSYTAPPTTHATIALVSSESEVEERDQVEVSQMEQQEPASTMNETSEPPKRKRGQLTKLTSLSQQPAVALATSESEVEGEMIEDGYEHDIVHETNEEPPKKKRGRPPKSSTLAPGASVLSESELDEVPREVVEFGALEGTVVLESPKKKKGRHRKSAKQAASSESELEDWLETVRKKRWHKGGVQIGKTDSSYQENNEMFQKSTPAANESRVIQIVQGKKSEVKRGRGRPRKSQAAGQSASSGSEMEGEKITQQNYGELQNGEIEQPKRGRPSKVVPTKPAVSVSSESELEEAIKQDQLDYVDVDRETQASEVAPKVPKRGRGRPRKSRPAQSTNQKKKAQLHKSAPTQPLTAEEESGSDEIAAQLQYESLQSERFEEEQGRGRLHKSEPVQEGGFASSESDIEGMEGYSRSELESEAENEQGRTMPGQVSTGESEGGGSIEVAHLEYEVVPVKKSSVKRGRGRPRKSAAPPASASGKSEVEELIKEVKQRGIPPPIHPPPAAPSDSLMTGEVGEEASLYKKKKKKKKKSKDKHHTDTENLNSLVTQGGTIEDEQQPIIEVGDEPQYDYVGYDNVVDSGGGDDDYESPLSPNTYDDHSGVGSKVTYASVQPTTTPGSAGSRGGQKAADLSGAESIDVSILPRLMKRKRARGNKLVLAPRSKKRKQNQMLDSTVQDPSVVATPETAGRTVDSHIYSMSTSGEEGEEESDHFEGVEIIQSGGGRKYRRLRVEPKKSHTPGVRRSKRTRIAPVRHWENEQLEYDVKNTSGAVLKGVLVPLAQDSHGEGPSRKRPNMAMIPERQLGRQEDDAFSPYRTTDSMGNTREMAIVHTLASASRIACSGQPVEEDSDADVIIHKLHSSPGTANGVMTFAGLGEKPKSSATNFDMYFYVLKGKLLFQVDDQEFALMPNSSINIPEGCVYCIRNTQHTRAEIYFYTHYIGPLQQ